MTKLEEMMADAQDIERRYERHFGKQYAPQPKTQKQSFLTYNLIYKALMDQKEPCTPNKIAEITGLTVNAVAVILGNLYRDGSVKKNEIKRVKFYSI
ncbi:MAG TPA: hypothetical protein DC015_03935 [Aequorivita sp.]|nr:hypothetical protein [Aequorivita sp.]|tara:strand:+ start:853 stop:1143 length:291 start_codon:yes stop_codon:yes gene_type:complete